MNRQEKLWHGNLYKRMQLFYTLYSKISVTMESIHGHEVMHYLIENKPTREELVAHCTATFGAEAKYHTCSAENMDLEELISFLEKKQKFSVQSEKMIVDPTKVCNH